MLMSETSNWVFVVLWVTLHEFVCLHIGTQLPDSALIHQIKKGDPAPPNHLKS